MVRPIDRHKSVTVVGEIRDDVLTDFRMAVVVERNRSVLAHNDANKMCLGVCHGSLLAYETPSPQGNVILNDEIDTVSPAVMVVVFKFKSAPDVPTLPWKITVPAPFLMRK
jgi:hypothetical protein